MSKADDPIKNCSLKAPWMVAKLREDFGLTEEQAAAIVGNGAHESLGFTKLQEIRPVIRGSRGGAGFFMWTGPRRVAFEAYCKRNRLDPKSDKANYAWLFLELKGPEKKAIAALKATRTLRDAVVAFEQSYERAGVKHYASRQKWAVRALEAYRAANKAGLVAPHVVNPPSITGRKEAVKLALPAAGKLVGVAGALGSLAIIFGQPELAKALSYVTEDNIDALTKVVAAGGGLISLVAGLLPNRKAA